MGDSEALKSDSIKNHDELKLHAKSTEEVSNALTTSSEPVAENAVSGSEGNLCLSEEGLEEVAQVREAEDGGEATSVEVDTSGKETCDPEEETENPTEPQEACQDLDEPISNDAEEESREGLRLLEDIFTPEPVSFVPDRFEANDMKGLITEGFFRCVDFYFYFFKCTDTIIRPSILHLFHR